MDSLVSEVSKVDLKPKVAARFAHLVPSINSVRFSFVLTGVNVAVANGIRRAVSGEIIVKRLTCHVEDFSTNDLFVVPVIDKVICQIESIPLMQTAPVGASYLLKASNETTIVRKVHTSSIQAPKGLFNDGIVLFDLQPGSFLEVRVRVVEGSPSRHSEGMATLACLSSCVPLDVIPCLPYKVEGDRVVPCVTNGVSSLVADPRVHKIGFLTNGTASPAQLVVTACKSLAARTQDIIGAIGNFQLSAGDDPEYMCEIEESCTMGEIFMRSVLDAFPEIPMVAYKEDTIAGTIILRCRCDDLEQTVGSALRQTKDLFLRIGAQLA